MNTRFSSAEIAYFLVANVLVLGMAVYAYVLDASYPDFYVFSIQEDEYLEWSSFWAFLLAAVAFLKRSNAYRQATQTFPWFLYGVALFCFVVAMEEISWGQRVFGYRPPVYFLEHNFQQEFNFHNIIDTDYRKLALTLVIAGYGIILPVATMLRPLNNLLARIGIVAPSIALLPAFIGTLLIYTAYPWSHSGEWVESMLGLSFLFSAVLMPLEYGIGSQTIKTDAARSLSITAIAFVAVAVLGLASGAVSRMQRDAHPDNLQAAKLEVAAIASDFESGLANSRCNLHKRLYTFVEEYGQTNLLKGSYTYLQAQGLPEERAAFFLDPWNSPYWIRDRCNRRNNTRTIFIYSFGPDRQRDSTRTEILGDDIGQFVSAK